MDVERGSMGRLPYLAVGAGPPMVFLTGLAPDAGVESKATQRMSVPLVSPFAGRRRVFIFNRRRGLPRGLTMAELAGEHADAIQGSLGRAVDVIGISTGGSIAQQLAADHAGLVRRLVLVSSACRLGPGGRLLQRRVAARIRRGAHRRALAVMAAGLVPPGRGQLAAAAAAWIIGPRVVSGPDRLADMAATIEAEDGFDLGSCRTPIRAPTLIIAGREDRFYSPELFAETARLIPGSRLRLFERRGHVTVTSHPDFVPEIRRFLLDGDEAGAGPV